MLYQIYKHEPKASGCISDTTWPLMLYIAYDTPTSKCSCLSTILKIKHKLPHKTYNNLNVMPFMYVS